MSERREILVVTVPAGSIKPAEFGKFREYVIESILRDVLVVDDSMKMSIEEVPIVGASQVMVDVKLEEPKEETPTTNRLADTAQKMSAKEEKQDILRRLLDYRQRNGIGSLGDVARKTNIKSITVDVLRLLVNGDATLSITEWRAIGRALGKLEEIEKEAAGDG
jgi:hypothetical protein